MKPVLASDLVGAPFFCWFVLLLFAVNRVHQVEELIAGGRVGFAATVRQIAVRAMHVMRFVFIERVVLETVTRNLDDLLLFASVDFDPVTFDAESSDRRSDGTE